MIPLKTRDRLYRLFLDCLADPKAASGFEGLLADGDSDYLRDRIPRYRAVLAKNAKEPLAVAELLFNHGLFFDCHEYLESFWREGHGDLKTALQGIIQIAAGFHKLELDPRATAGAAELIEKGQAKLRESGMIDGKLERGVPAIRLRLQGEQDLRRGGGD